MDFEDRTLQMAQEQIAEFLNKNKKEIGASVASNITNQTLGGTAVPRPIVDQSGAGIPNIPNTPLQLDPNILAMLGTGSFIQAQPGQASGVGGALGNLGAQSLGLGDLSGLGAGAGSAPNASLQPLIDQFFMQDLISQLLNGGIGGSTAVPRPAIM